MSKIYRNVTTSKGQQFWKSAQEAAAPVRDWPAWRRAGINVSTTRTEQSSSAPSKARKPTRAPSDG